MFRIHIHEPHKDQNGRNMIAFFNDLSKLTNVVSLEIEIGEHNVLFTNHLEKLDNKLSLLPFLKNFSFSCTVDMPTNWAFPQLRSKIPYGGKFELKLSPRNKKQML